MKHLYFIGMADCGDCNVIRRDLIEPLKEKYPGQVHVLYGWCADLARINGRQTITNVPTFVVEDHGVEEFRFSGTSLTGKELESLVTTGKRSSDHG